MDNNTPDRIPIRFLMQEVELFMQVSEDEEFSEDPTAFLVNKWFARATTRVGEISDKVTFDHNAALMSGTLAFGGYMSAFGPASHAF